MLGEIAALGAALVFSISGSITTRLSHRMGALALIAWQGLMGTVVFLVIFAISGKWPDLYGMPPKAILGFVADALVGVILGGTLFIASLRLIGLSRAMPISSTYPLFATLIAALAFREPVSWGLVAAIPLVIGGVFLLSISGPKGDNPRAEPRRQAVVGDNKRGIASALGAALMWALATSILKIAVRDADLMAGALIGNSTLTVAAFLLARPGRSVSELRQLGQTSACLLALSAVFEMALAPLFYFFAVQQAGIARTSVLGSASPIFALPLAVLFLAERLTAGKAFGLILCTFGAVLAFS